MMRILFLAALLFALAIQAVNAQIPAAERAVDEGGGWKTVLESGTLGRNAEIVPVRGGFAVSAESFEDPTWFFDSDWVLYDPDTDTWSPMSESPYSSVMVSIRDESLAHHRLAERLPKESTEAQIVNGGAHAVFLQYPGWNPGHYKWGMSIIDLSSYEITELTYWRGGDGPRQLVRDFPEENVIIANDLLVWMDGREVQKHWLEDCLETSEFTDPRLVSMSPDNRFWLLRAEYVDTDSGYANDAGLLLDLMTGNHKVLFVGIWEIPSSQHSVWLDNGSLLINRRDDLLLVDAVSGEQTKLMEAELEALDQLNLYTWRHLSTDWRWLLAELYNEGSLLIHKVYDKNTLGA